MTSAGDDQAMYQLNLTDAEWEAWAEGAEIDRQARAWEAQLQNQGIRPVDAHRIAQRQAGWQGWALAERQAATTQAEAGARITAARAGLEASQRAVLAEASAPEAEAGS